MKAMVCIDRNRGNTFRLGEVSLDVELNDGCPLVVIKVSVPCENKGCPIDVHLFEVAIDAQDAPELTSQLVPLARGLIRFGSDGGHHDG